MKAIEELRRTYPEDVIVPMGDLSIVLDAAEWCASKRKGNKVLWMAAV